MAGAIDKLRFQVARYRWLREYYARQHLEVVLPGLRLADDDDTTIGFLEEVRVHQGRVHLRGWVQADSISVMLGTIEITRYPRDKRSDVAAAVGCDPEVGFSMSLPLDDSTLLIELRRAGGEIVSLRHELPSIASRARARLGLELRFWRDLVPVLPRIYRGLKAGDPDLARQVKAALRLGQNQAHTRLDRAFVSTAEAPAPGTPNGPITIILPIYNAFELLEEALGRVVENTDLDWRLIVIEDCSSDARVRPWLRDWVKTQAARFPGRIQLLENDPNRGFIGSVNRGFDAVADDSGPVVLLNSDAMVPPGWASRLIAPLSDASVATATPLSNDAEIYTMPVICSRLPIGPGQVDAIDAAVARRVAADAPRVSTPTGVGFCMAMGRDWIARVGHLDTAFGRGYGEEVDWCRRAVALGGVHVAVPNLFVEHRGGASFGPEKLKLVEKNNAIISKRYPGYDAMVQDFIRDDPLATPRLVAALAWADGLADVDHVPVFIAHSMGGGAEAYLQDRMTRHSVSLTLRFGGAHRCRVELATPFGRLTGDTDDLGLVTDLVGRLARRRIVYSCAVGDPDLAALPDLLLALSKDAPLEVLFHDYLPLSPSYTLVDHDGTYRDVPAEDTTDAAHVYRRPDRTPVTLAQWRASWRAVLARAEQVVVFSQAAADIVTTAYPELAGRDGFEIRPHALLHEIPTLAAPRGPRQVIGVLGAIGPQKGAAVVGALSHRVAGEEGIDLALIGRITPEVTLARGTAVHGAYKLHELAELGERYAITHWLIPSIWPETFSYTVHECLATGLPTMAFDLGAQGAAVARADNGILLPWVPGQRDPADLAGLVVAHLRAT